MLTSWLIDGTNVIHASWDGTLTAADVAGLRDEVRFVASTYGDARVLVEFPDAARVEPTAVWEDLKSVGAVGGIQRIALVTDERWAETVADVAGAALPTEIEVFDSVLRDEAVAWVTS